MNFSNFEIEFEKIINRDYFSKSLHAHRKKAFSKLKKIGFPTSKWENWQFTNLNPITNSNFNLSDLEDAPKNISNFDSYNLNNIKTIVIYNGHYQKTLSNIPEGLQILNGLEYLNKKNGKFESIDYSPFDLLNTAFTDCSINLVIDNNKEIKEPIRILFISDGDKSIMINPRLNIDLGKSSSLTFIEHHIGKASSFFQNESLFISLNNNSNLNHYCIQSNSNLTNNISNINIKQEQDSQYNFFQLIEGSMIHRTNMYIHLNKNNAICNLNCLSLSSDTQHFDNNFLVNHNSQNTHSSQFVRSILKDSSTCVFNGKALVKEGAQKITASQINNNLILSKKAKVNSIPQLEIFADDVKCSHGSTTGQIDDDALFYLQSRGINKFDALKIMINGFANEIIETINDKIIKQYISNIVNDKINNIIN